MQLNVTVLIPVEKIVNMAETVSYDDPLLTLVARYIQEELYDEVGMGGEFLVTNIAFGDDASSFKVSIAMRFPYSYWAAARTIENLLDPLQVNSHEGWDLMAPTTFDA